MKNVFKKALALFLCVWMLCTMGLLGLAASDEPYEPVVSITLSSTTLSMTYGGTATLTATVLPAGADTRVTWKSSDPALVQVDAYGNLTAAKDTAETPSGKKTATITVTSVANAKVSATCTVTVDNDSGTKLGVVLKELLTALKSIVTVLADPSKEFFKTITDFIQQFLKSDILKTLLGAIGITLPVQS